MLDISALLIPEISEANLSYAEHFFKEVQLHLLDMSRHLAAGASSCQSTSLISSLD
jgi:hypothetical protein